MGPIRGTEDPDPPRRPPGMGVAVEGLTTLTSGVAVTRREEKRLWNLFVKPHGRVADS